MDFCYGPSTFNQFLWEIENKWFALLTVETVSVTMLNRCSIKMNSFNNNLWCAIVLVRPLSRLPMATPIQNAQMWIYSNLALNRFFASCHPEGSDKVGVVKCKWFCETLTLYWVLSIRKQSGEDSGLRRLRMWECLRPSQTSIIGTFGELKVGAQKCKLMFSSCSIRKLHSLHNVPSHDDHLRRICEMT